MRRPGYRARGCSADAGAPAVGCPAQHRRALRPGTSGSPRVRRERAGDTPAGRRCRRRPWRRRPWSPATRGAAPPPGGPSSEHRAGGRPPAGDPRRTALVVLDVLNIHRPRGSRRRRALLAEPGGRLVLDEIPAVDPEANRSARLWRALRRARPATPIADSDEGANDLAPARRWPGSDALRPRRRHRPWRRRPHPNQTSSRAALGLLGGPPRRPGLPPEATSRPEGCSSPRSS
jgi:hypothetical protein